MDNALDCRRPSRLRPVPPVPAGDPLHPRADSPRPLNPMAWKRALSRIDAVNLYIGRAVSWLTLAMVLITTVDVILRYLFNTGWVAVQEAEWHLFGFVFLLGAGYTLLYDGHVRVDIFYAKRSRRTRAWIDLAGTLVFLLPVCVLVIWSSHKFVLNAWIFAEGSPDPGGLPARYILKTAIPVAFGLVAVQGVADALRAVLVLTGPEDEE